MLKAIGFTALHPNRRSRSAPSHFVHMRDSGLQFYRTSLMSTFRWPAYCQN